MGSVLFLVTPVYGVDNCDGDRYLCGNLCLPIYSDNCVCGNKALSLSTQYCCSVHYGSSHRMFFLII